MTDKRYVDGYNASNSAIGYWSGLSTEIIIESIDFFKEDALSYGGSYFLGVADRLWQLVLTRKL